MTAHASGCARSGRPRLGLRLRRAPHPGGRKFRMLCVVEEFTREALAIRVAPKLGSADVIDLLTDLFVAARHHRLEALHLPFSTVRRLRLQQLIEGVSGISCGAAWVR